MDDRERKEAGRAAEDAALRHLERRGLTLIVRNYRCNGGEIDLVMLDGATLVLIEVRYRASDRFGGAAASITWRKQQRIVRAARHLLRVRPQLCEYPARFDVVAIAGDGGGTQVNWITNAFTL